MSEFRTKSGRPDRRFSSVRNRGKDSETKDGESFSDFRERRNSSGSRSGSRDFRGGGRDFRGGRDSRGGGRDSRGKLEMFPAVCDDCKKDCEVPFKPTSSKPIYCSDCFEKREGSSSSRRDSRGGRDRGDRGASRSSGPSTYDLDVINRKLDKIMKKLDIE